MPKQPGRYRLQAPDGRVETVKVISMDGMLYAIRGWWLFSYAIPLVGVRGTWAGAA